VTDVLTGAHIAGCRIEAVAGRGGMGIVYRATELSLARPVALKLIAPQHAADASFRERFERESRMAAAIDHPNIIPVYAAGEEDGRLYLVMRWVEGTDLHRLLRNVGRLEPLRAARIVAQVGDALDAAHAAGLVHRDIKPANVLLSGDHAYLADFGLMREAGSADTSAEHFMGTVDYMAPEQFRSDAVDARTDVYALGCVLFAALTGGPPFPRETVPATMSAHLHEAPPLPRTLPLAFHRVLQRALAKHADDRYPSAGDLGRAALAAAEGRSVTEAERSVARGAAAPRPATARTERQQLATTRLPGAGALPRIRRPRRRWRGRLLALTTLALVAAAAIVYGLDRTSGAADPPPPGGTVSASEAERYAKAFAAAYGSENVDRLAHLLTADVQRVTPTDRQRGRDTVVAAYKSQFDSHSTIGFTLANLRASGGAAARASADYTIRYSSGAPVTGRMTWIVIRDHDKPRILLIEARPS